MIDIEELMFKSINDENYPYELTRDIEEEIALENKMFSKFDEFLKDSDETLFC